jgi:PTH2 family peptidyl-tRNA hydrolase
VLCLINKDQADKQIMEASEAPKIKQVIVMRHDLKMRRGKQIAQGAHASMSFITRKLQSQPSICIDDFSHSERTWILGSFAKVCVRCNSEEELMAIHDKAIDMGLEVHLITDSGRTEFHGQPTRTCLAIGPDEASKIDHVTGHLELL